MQNINKLKCSYLLKHKIVTHSSDQVRKSIIKFVSKSIKYNLNYYTNIFRQYYLITKYKDFSNYI